MLHPEKSYCGKIKLAFFCALAPALLAISCHQGADYSPSPRLTQPPQSQNTHNCYPGTYPFEAVVTSSDGQEYVIVGCGDCDDPDKIYYIDGQGRKADSCKIIHGTAFSPRDQDHP